MSEKENLIIARLAKIASNQQKIIEKLVIIAQSDETIDYLQRTANTAIFNSGLTGTTVSAELNGDNGSYTVIIHGAPDDNNVKQSFIDNFNKTISAQKPELDGNVNIIFN